MITVPGTLTLGPQNTYCVAKPVDWNRLEFVRNAESQAPS